MNKKMKKSFLTRISFNILLLGTVSFLADMSSEMIMPILPMFIVALGGTGLIVGLIGSLGESITSTLKFFSGYWSDKFGKRKPFVFSGYATSAISKLFLPLSTIWYHVLILKPLERVGKGLRTAPRDAIIADFVGKRIRGKGFGIHRAMDTSGAILGSALALILFWFFGLDFKLIILIAAIVAFFALIPLYFVREKKRKPKKITLKIGLKGLPKPLRLFILIASIFAVGNFTYMFFILRAQQFFALKLAIAIPILLYVFFNIFYALFSIPSGILSDKIGRKKVLILGYSLFGLTCLGFTFLHSLPWFIVLFGLYGLFYALIDGTQRAFVSDLSPSELRATALGTFHTAIGMAALPASIIAGALWEINPSLTFAYGAGTGLLAAMLLIITMRQFR